MKKGLEINIQGTLAFKVVEFTTLKRCGSWQWLQDADVN